MANKYMPRCLSGEVVKVYTTVHNESTLTVRPRATLYETQIYMCGERHKGVETALSESVVGKDVPANDSITDCLLLSIPEKASLTIKTPIISIKHFIDVTLDIPHAFDIHVNLPFVATTRSALNTQD